MPKRPAARLSRKRLKRVENVPAGIPSGGKDNFWILLEEREAEHAR
jgi:hypothetical protein